MIRYVKILLVAFTLIIASFVHAESPPQKVRVAAFNFYPTFFQAKDGSVKGSYVDLLTEIAKRENWDIEFVYGTWADGLAKIKAGEVDVLANVAYTPERSQYMDFGTIPLLTVWAELYVSNGSDIHGIRDIHGKKIAVMKGDFNAAIVRDLSKKFEISSEFVEFGNFEEGNTWKLI